MRPASLPGQPPKAGQKINFRQRQKSGAGRNLSDKDKAGRRREPRVANAGRPEKGKYEKQGKKNGSKGSPLSEARRQKLTGKSFCFPRFG